MKADRFNCNADKIIKVYSTLMLMENISEKTNQKRNKRYNETKKTKL